MQNLGGCKNPAKIRKASEISQCKFFFFKDVFLYKEIFLYNNNNNIYIYIYICKDKNATVHYFFFCLFPYEFRRPYKFCEISQPLLNFLGTSSLLYKLSINLQKISQEKLKKYAGKLKMS